MKQTAIDWLVMKWATQKTLYSSDITQGIIMEKQQIEDAFDEGVCEGFDYATIKDTIDSDTGKQYYNETYGKDA